MSQNLKYFIKTFGCTYNKNSSNIMQGLLSKNEYIRVKNVEFADIIIINTCIVKINTESKILYLLKELTEKYPKKIMIVAGCMAEEMSGIVKKISSKINLIGPFYVTEIINVIHGFLQDSIPKEYIGKRVEDKLNQPKILATKLIDIIPISQGCVNNCHYCIVKKAMGKLNSYSINEILISIKRSIQNGIKEIQLTAQDLSAYGLDSNRSLVDVINGINKIEGEFRVRLGMMNPSTLLPIIDDFLNACHNNKIYKFFHLPMQSGDNEVLSKMNRKYQVTDFLFIYNKIKSEFKELCLSTDIICGYPGETDANFGNTLKLIKKIKPDIINISKYGHRAGTYASTLKDLRSEVKKERSKALHNLFEKYREQKIKKMIGKSIQVLFLKKKSKNLYWGRSETYYPIYIESNRDLLSKILSVKINEIKGKKIFGILK